MPRHGIRGSAFLFVSAIAIVILFPFPGYAGSDSKGPVWDSTEGIQNATSIAPDSVTVSWNNATDAKTPPVDYNIYYDTVSDPFTAGTKLTAVIFVAGSGYDLQCTVSDLTITPNTTYWFGVRAQDSWTPTNEETNTVVLSNCTLAAIPAAFSVDLVNVNTIEFSWSENTNPPWTTYCIQWDSDFDNNWTGGAAELGNQTTLSFSHGGLIAGTSYYYRIMAFNLNGIETGWLYGWANTTITFLNPPSGFGSTPPLTTEITWGWIDTNTTPNEEGFQLLDNVSGALLIDDIAADSNQTAETGLSENEIYTRQVRAFADGKLSFSDNSNSFAMCTLAHDPLDGEFDITAISPTSVCMSIVTPPNGALGCTGSFFTFSSGGAGGVDSGWLEGIYEYTDAGLTPNTTYAYNVRFRNQDDTETLSTSDKSVITPANIPISFSVDFSNLNTIQFSWNDNTNPAWTTYSIQWDSDFDNNWVGGATELGNQTTQSYSHGSLSPNTSYFYRIMAVNLNGIETGWLYGWANTTFTVLNPPSGFSGTPTSITEITWSWTDTNTSPNEEGFQLLDNVSGTLQVDNIAVDAIGTSETGLSENVLYTRQVRAFADSKTSFSDNSNNFAACTFVADPLDGEFDITAISATSVCMSIVVPPNSALGCTGSFFTFSTGGAGAADSGWLEGTYEYTDAGLTPNTTYAYNVKLRNQDDTETLTTSDKSVITPANVPISFSVDVASPDTIQFSWNANTNPAWTTYSIQWDSDFDNNWAGGATELGNQTMQSFSHGSLSPNTSYFYRVMAVDMNGIETSWLYGWANTTFTQLNAPSGLSVNTVSTNSITWEWTDTNSSPNEEGLQLIDNSSGAVAVDDIAADSTYTIEAGLSENTEYARKVRAFADGKTTFSDNSNAVSTYTLVEDPLDVEFNITAISPTSVCMSIIAPPNPSAGLTGSCFSSISVPCVWGRDYYGQLGHGLPGKCLSPVRTVIEDVVVNTAGSDGHSLAVLSNGSVLAWGRNANGQLGDGTTTQRETPVLVSDISNAISSSAGAYHSLSALSNGSVLAWGSNSYGQLGDGTTTQRETPVLVSDITNGVSVSAGDYFSLSVLSNGSILTWGYNGWGQLGDGTTTQRETPVLVSGITDAVYAVAGAYHALAVLSNGSVLAWGRNNYGQLGDGTTTQRELPVLVSGITDAISVAANWDHSLAVLSNGSVLSWGLNSYGQLGDGTSIQRETPVFVSGITDAVSVTAGSLFSHAILSNGSVVGWGRNSDGQLGDGTTTSSYLPVFVSNITDASSFSSGGSHTVAVLADGSVHVWGTNNYGQLGIPVIQYITPRILPGIPNADSVGAGVYHSLSSLSDGSVLIWGRNNYGQLGDGTTTQRNVPIFVSGITNALSVTGGSFHSLATLSNGSILSWGYNHMGQLGDGFTTTRYTPVHVSGISTANSSDAGGSHSITLLSDGSVRSWGSNNNGELGDGTNTRRLTSVPVPGITDAVYISAGIAHSLAVLSDGTVRAWGLNNYGQLGDGTTENRNSPVSVSGISNAVSVAGGQFHSLALLDNGSILSWGQNTNGQLGDGTNTQHETPVLVSGITNAVAIVASSAHSHAILANGSVFSWGTNYYGQLGDGTTTNRNTPVMALYINGAVSIAAGWEHTLAICTITSGWLSGQYTKTFSDLTPNATYYFRAKLRNGDGVETAWTGNKSVLTPCAEPGWPWFSNVSETGMTLHWSANGNPEWTDYYTEMSLDNATFDTVLESTGFEYSNNSLTGGTTYYFRIAASDVQGENSAWIYASQKIPALIGPESFGYSNLTTDSITWKWVDKSGKEEGFQILDNVGEIVVIDDIAADATFTIETGLSENTEYARQARAFTDVKTTFSDNSNTVSTYTLIEDPLDGEFDINAISSTSVCMSIVAPPNSALGSTGSFFTFASGGAGAADSDWLEGVYEYTDAGLTANTTYAYNVKLRSQDATETLTTSNKSVITPANIPINFSVDQANQDTIQFSWNANTNPTWTTYSIQWDSDFDNSWTGGATELGNQTSLSYSHDGLTPNTSYFYRVMAVDMNGLETGWLYGWANTSSDPTMSGLHLENVGGTTYSTAGDIPAGTTTLYMHYISYYGGPNGMAQVDYGFDIDQAGSTVSSPQDTVFGDPPPRGEFTGLSLNGACRLSSLAAMLVEAVTFNGGIAFGSTHYIKPYQPQAPTVATVVGNETVLDVNVNPHASEHSAVTYGIRNTDLNRWVQADGSLGVVIIMRTDSAWGTIRVTGLSPGTNYTFEVTAYNYYTTSVSNTGPTANATTFLGDSTPPVVTGAHLQNSGGTHFNQFGDITAGSQISVIHSHYDSIVEANPNFTEFKLVYSINGSTFEDIRYDFTDTTDPGPENHPVETLLNGYSKVYTTITHSDQVGNNGSHTSIEYYVKPYMPQASVVTSVPGNAYVLDLDVIPHASENDSISYSIYMSTWGWIDADNNIGVRVQRTDSGWGTVRINQLSPNTTYTFYARAYNYYSGSAWINGPNVSCSTEAEVPLMTNSASTFTGRTNESITVAVGLNGNPDGTAMELFYASGTPAQPTGSWLSAGWLSSGYSWTVDNSGQGLIPDTSYWFKARAQYYAAQLTGNCSLTVWSTLAGPPPGAFNLLKPANSGTVKNTEIQLSWECASDADWYYVFCSDVDPPAYIGCTAETTCFTGVLTDEQTHYWKIIATNENGNTSSAMRSFCISVPKKLAWARSASGGIDDWGISISTLSDGTALVTGFYSSTATFGAGDDNETILTSAGGYDIFIVKYNPDGTLAWAKSAGSTKDDWGMGISTLSDGSALTTGYYGNTATFGAGDDNETELTSAEVDNIFVAKYNPDGTLAWAKQAGGAGEDWGGSISTLSDGSAIITGDFTSAAATFGNASEGNEVTLSAVGNYDIFVAKYNPDGTLAWAKQAGGTDWDEGWGVSVVSDGSSIVTGIFRSTATFGNASEGNEAVLSSAGDHDIFIAKYNSDGTLNWAKSAGNVNRDLGRGICALSDGSAIVTGLFNLAVTFGNASEGGNETVITSAGGDDIFIAKYNSDGTLNWAKRAGGGSFDYGHAISTLSDGSALVTGDFSTTATFGLGEGNETVLSCAGIWDIFVAKYNPDGTLAWAKRAGNGNTDEGWGISALSDGSALVTGYFDTSATFGAGEDNETTLVPGGSNNTFFLARYGEMTPPADPPGEPDGLRVKGYINPTAIADNNSVTFNAIYRDPAPSSNANAAWIQVDDDPGFGSLHTSTGWLTISETIPDTRCQAIPYAGPALTAGTTYYWRIRFRNTDGQESPFSTVEAYFATAFYTQELLYKGYHLLDLPCNTGGKTFQQLFGNDIGGTLWIYCWEETANSWVQVGANTVPEDNTGYIIWAYGATILGMNGDSCDGTGNITIDVTCSGDNEVAYWGYNLVRNPFTSDITWSNCDLQNCEATHWRPWDKFKGEYEWYNTSGPSASECGSNTIPGGASFWVHCIGNNAYVTMYDPLGAPQRLTPPALQWRLPIRTRTGAYSDTSTYAAVCERAASAYDTYDVVEIKPFAYDYVQAYFSHPEWGRFRGPYTQDTRSFPGLGGMITWKLTVYATDADGFVYLSWEVPEVQRDYWRFYFRDDASGIVKDMAVFDAYDYPASGKDTRTFTLTATCLGTRMLGDANLDGEVTTEDAVICARNECGLEILSPEQRYVSDLNNDGKIDIFDALLILRRLRGHIQDNP
ncbi:MAG: RCC1 domain-containing protein [Planctomycetota bacterium]